MFFVISIIVSRYLKVNGIVWSGVWFFFFGSIDINNRILICMDVRNRE